MKYPANPSSIEFDTGITHIITGGLIMCCMMMLAQFAAGTKFFADALEPSNQSTSEVQPDELQENMSGFRPASELVPKLLGSAPGEVRSVAGIEQPNSAGRTF